MAKQSTATPLHSSTRDSLRGSHSLRIVILDWILATSDRFLSPQCYQQSVPDGGKRQRTGRLSSAVATIDLLACLGRRDEGGGHRQYAAPSTRFPRHFLELQESKANLPLPASLEDDATKGRSWDFAVIFSEPGQRPVCRQKQTATVGSSRAPCGLKPDSFQPVRFQVRQPEANVRSNRSSCMLL